MEVEGNEVISIDRKFFSRSKQNRIRVCFLLAGSGNVADRAEECMAGEGPQPSFF